MGIRRAAGNGKRYGHLPLDALVEAGQSPAEDSKKEGGDPLGEAIKGTGSQRNEEIQVLQNELNF